MGAAQAGQRYAKEALASALTALWARLEPEQPWTPPVSLAPSDHVQRHMNLVLPLRHPNIFARSQMTRELVKATDEVLAGLSKVGTIHFARFDIIEGNLCMFSVYDGDLKGYVRDFISTIGNVLEALFAWVKDPPILPVGSHVDEFISWIEAHDAFQMPEQPTGLIRGNLSTLPRDTILRLHRNPSVQLGVYRGYPGFSAAQIRHHLSVGW